MKEPGTLQFTIRQVNSEYDQSYADQYHQGEESDTNQKYHWSHSWNMTKVDSVKELKSQTRSFQIVFDEQEVEAAFSNLRVYCFEVKGKTFEIAIEESLLEKVISYSDASRNTKRVYFYLKDNCGYYRVSERLYLPYSELQKLAV